MTLQVKQLVQVDITGRYVWSTNKTGAFDAVANPTGFGGDNPSLANSAILGIAIRVADNQALSLVTAHQIQYSQAAADTDEVQFQWDYPSVDGHIKVWQMRLWVSDDGIIDKSGDHNIEEGDFFFVPANPDVVFLKTGSGVDDVEEVTDLQDLIDSEDETNPYQVMCEDLFVNHLAKKTGSLNKDKRLARNKEDNHQVEELRDKITDITQGIQSADYTFRGGLTVEANNQIESLSDDYL